MKQMKRIVAIVLAGVLALSVLTGCSAVFQKDDLGEALVAAAMELINTDRGEDDQLENNKTIRRKLQWMLENCIDKDTLEKDDKYQYLFEIDGNGAPVQRTKLYYVMPNEFRSEGNTNSLVAFLGELKEFAESNDVKITDFAVTYLVIEDDTVGDNLFVAVGGEIESTFPVNLDAIFNYF